MTKAYLCANLKNHTKMTYSNENLELFWLRYQAEGVPAKMSLQQFCSTNKVPYNIVKKWYQDTRTKVAEVKIQGEPENIAAAETEASKSEVRENPLRIMIDIRLSNGLQIRRKNLDYPELRRLIGNLEVLC